MKLNCDLGEGLDTIDAALMPHIDMASIACGGHTGDEHSMARAIELALSHQVSIGAHPSYPDRAHFGRESLNLPSAALFDNLCDQINQLKTTCERLSAELHYIKPHGALYNDAWHNQDILNTLQQVAKIFSLPLVLQARLDVESSASMNAAITDIATISEAFADRAYTDAGTLVSRQFKHATHSDIDKVVEQALDIHLRQGLYSENHNWLSLSAATLCIHSDSPNALASAIAVKQALDKNSDARPN